jgi:hypothetical protein
MSKVDPVNPIPQRIWNEIMEAVTGLDEAFCSDIKQHQGGPSNRISVPSFQEWILAQAHRDDDVGALAKQWVSSGERTPDEFKAWIKLRRSGLILKPGVESAEREYASAADNLNKGQKTQTFPALFNRPEINAIQKRSGAFHKAHPDISPSVYLHALHVRLAQKIEPRRIIYIDTCHWVKMRHWLLDDFKKEPVYQKVLELLRKLKSEGQIVCPISFPMFTELMRQSDARTRTATAKLMDEFSDGICLQFPGDLMRLELRQQMLRSVLKENAPGMEERIWTKVGYLTGERFPVSSGFSKEDVEYLQKTFLDFMWHARLEDKIDMLDQQSFPQGNGSMLASAHNSDANFYKENQMAFAKVLEREKGLLFHIQLKGIFEQTALEIQQDYPDQAAKATASQTLEKKPDPFVLPSLQIIAGINAIFMTSREKFIPNDLVDAEHAALALPYCDIFFCDDPLAHKLKSSPLKLDTAYQTTVISCPKFLLEAMESI